MKALSLAKTLDRSMIARLGYTNCEESLSVDVPRKIKVMYTYVHTYIYIYAGGFSCRVGNYSVFQFCRFEACWAIISKIKKK